MKAPLLAVQTYDCPDRGHERVRVLKGGLSHINGNRLPHFTLTCEDREVGKRLDSTGPADERTLRENFPAFLDLMELHLSDARGVPMHAVDNAWYWLKAARDNGKGAGERQHWKPDGTFDGYRESTREELLTLLSDHLRVRTNEAHRLLETCDTKQDLADYVETLRPRWAAEAAAAIADHGITFVHGDAWLGEPIAGVCPYVEISGPLGEETLEAVGAACLTEGVSTVGHGPRCTDASEITAAVAAASESGTSLKLYASGRHNDLHRVRAALAERDVAYQFAGPVEYAGNVRGVALRLPGSSAEQYALSPVAMLPVSFEPAPPSP